MVGAGQPQGFIALHPPETDQDILQGIVKRVSHVQLARDVGRRDHDGIGLLIGVFVRAEVSLLLPAAVEFFLYVFRIVCFFHFDHIVTYLIFSRCQMSSTYSWMVRSDENLPEQAMLRIAMAAQAFLSRYALSTRSCACA